MTVHVIGPDGMLGNYVWRYLQQQKHNVVTWPRFSLDILALTSKSLQFIQEGDVVVNCAGIIKQKHNIPREEMIVVNSVFPHSLAKECKNVGAKLIHITTDCVFSGHKGKYIESDRHDAFDDYGRTKSLGEPWGATVIRTSIIGEERKGKLSLVEWIKSRAGKEVDGYTNHFWNGITCLQFAKIVDVIIKGNLFWEHGPRHIYSPQDYTKLFLVKLINEIYGLNIKIKPSGNEYPCDRTLRSSWNNVIDFNIPSIEEQIKEMKEFGV